MILNNDIKMRDSQAEIPSRIPQSRCLSLLPREEMDKVARQLGRLFNLPRSYSSERALPELSLQFN